ncbi:MAG TPA: helix-turn-helix domain-containing protein [Bacteroidia bacterium]|nr:helix-turn-helix domain-containing protein [Bacteroidia bacterium]
MPEFLFDNKIYYNPVDFALDRIGGAWKMPILWRLKDNVLRYGELKNDITPISHKVLSQKLKELEQDGFISRMVYASVPPKVEYSLTKRGMRSIKVITIIRDYGLDLMSEYKIEAKKGTKKKG